MKRIFATLAPLSLVLAVPIVPASAQAPAAITVGMVVVDPAGAPVGTVKALQGANLVVTTGKHDVTLPKSSFTVAEGKLLFGMTQAQLNAEVEKSLAAASASIQAGATVKGVQGTPVGTIESADADSVTVALQSGQKVRLSRSGVRGNADGTVSIGLSAEQLQAQVGSGASDSTPASN